MMPKYKALYLPGATEEDIPKINEALILMEAEINPYTFFPPAATFHRFMTGLTGGKMSSSDPATAIFLSDTPEEGMKKVRSSITGGGTTVEEHKKHGGKPEVCSVYELFVYHILEDDDELRAIYEECKGGRRLCGECKKQAAEGIGEFLEDLAKKREEARTRLDQYIHYN
jgi:tryptophanyl-tRNA synthetase